MAALSDRALIEEVRAGDPRAWSEFLERFRGPLEHFARNAKIPNADWPECIQDVLEEAVMHLSEPDALIPDSIVGYLVRRTRSRFLDVRRRKAVAGRYAELAESEGDEPVLRCMLSDAAHKASGQHVDDEAESTTRALESVAIRLRAALSAADQELLVWVEHRVPYRHIAEWLGASYAATAKRIWRLQRRLQDVAARSSADATPDEQREIDRVLRRVAPHTRPARSERGASRAAEDTRIDGAVDPERR